MKPSKQLIDFVAHEEGFKSSAYKPFPWDRWTVGHGFTFIKGIPVEEDDTITYDESLEILEDELNLLAKKLQVLGKIPESVTQNQFDAVLSLCYNVGVSAFVNADTGKRFYKGENISFKFPLWNKSGGMVIKGLTDRRKREQKIYDKSEYDTSW